MLVTEGVRDALRSRARMTAAVRRLLEARGFLEVPDPWRAGVRAGTALSSLMCCQLTKGRLLPRCTHSHTPSERTPRPESAGRLSSKKLFCVCCPCMHAQQDSGKALLSTRAGRALVETRVLGRHAGGGGYGCIAIIATLTLTSAPSPPRARRWRRRCWRRPRAARTRGPL